MATPPLAILFLFALFINATVASLQSTSQRYSLSYTLAPSPKLRGAKQTCDASASKAAGRVVSLEMTKGLNAKLHELRNVIAQHGATSCRQNSCQVNLVEHSTNVVNQESIISATLLLACKTAVQKLAGSSRIDDRCRENLQAATCEVALMTADS